MLTYPVVEGHSDEARAIIRPATSDTSNNHPSSSHDVSEYEAYRYYAGLSGFGGRGPKLIYRTSTDKFAPPRGPEAYRRLMKLRNVPENHQLGKDRLWDRIRSEVVRLLDQRGIWFSSVDLARFAWIEKKYPDPSDEAHPTEEVQEPEQVQEPQDYDELPHFKPYNMVYITPATIWIGVMPDTTTAKQAYGSSRDILNMLKQHNVTDVEVAYRESEVTFSAGPALFAPALWFKPLKGVIDSLSTALSVPISRLGMDTQGALAFYFMVGEDLHAVTARHVLFKDYEPNIEYNYVVGPKKEVVVMGPSAFTAHLAFLQMAVRRLEISAQCLEDSMLSLKAQVESGGPRTEKARGFLLEKQRELTTARTKKDAITEHIATVRKDWRKEEDRVIGHVVWAPPLGVAAPPHQPFMQDICVVKLDRDKFRHFVGNMFSLGPDIEISNFVGLMCNNRFDAPREFDYPPDGHLQLRGILTEEEMRTTTPGLSIRRVIKRGPTTLTTIGRLSAYNSHVRRYYPTGHLDSVEVAVHSDDKNSLPFSMGGDSGSAIVDARGRFVALLTGGAGINEITYGTPSTEITYGTPMHWLWPLIVAKFDGATLNRDDGDESN